MIIFIPIPGRSEIKVYESVETERIYLGLINKETKRFTPPHSSYYPFTSQQLNKIADYLEEIE